ncbi:MAG: indole-3-glycerol-phosphate synthase TrpC, partial [Anaerolineae bacterium]
MPAYSKLDIAKYKGKVLDEIMAWKRQEVPKQMEQVPLAQVKAFATLAPPALDLAASLTARPGASLIAEVKRAS